MTGFIARIAATVALIAAFAVAAVVVIGPTEPAGVIAAVLAGVVAWGMADWALFYVRYALRLRRAG